MSIQLSETKQEFIEIIGAREHNLKNIDLKLPRNALIVITGVSGSGKSSLAFDTIYAEGQRRYMESFSAYARSFIGNMERPDVDKIEGLSPVISIEQKTSSKNPRSTVGTVTEIYDFFRLLYARAGEAYSYLTGKKMVQQTEEQIIKKLLLQYSNEKITLLAPLVKGRKGHYRELFVSVRKLGFSKVRIDGKIFELTPKMQVDRYKTHDIELIVDRILVNKKEEKRIRNSVQNALKQGDGIIMVQTSNDSIFYFSKNLMDPETGLSYDNPAPNNFSFNSPYGACKNCNGLGQIETITKESIIPNPSLSIGQGGLVPLGEYREIWIFKKIEKILEKNKVDLSTPINKISQKILDILLYGDDDPVFVKSQKYPGTDWKTTFEGIIPFLEKQKKEGSDKIREWIKDFTDIKICNQCNGNRLNKEALHYKINGKNISELAFMNLHSLIHWTSNLEDHLNERQKVIAKEILKEINKRIVFLLDVGLDYLHLNRPLKTLSGGEAQRIRLATQIGTQLVNVLYILDEPSIGLHQRDNVKLIQTLKNLRDLGNTVIVVEHDKDMMLSSDWIVDIGPDAGVKGGDIVAMGHPKDFIKHASFTTDFLQGKRKIEIPTRRKPISDHWLLLMGATGHNLKNVDLRLPLRNLIVVTGVSGSGKSTLIHETLYPLLRKKHYNSRKNPLPYKKIEGDEKIDKVIEIDQSPIGRTPRSNSATYTGVFSEIRNLFTQLPEAKIRGYKPGRFSFNVTGGRCETCSGGGIRIIEMDFLPDVHIICETCKGKRYNRETLEIRFKGKSIADILDMTVAKAVNFFDNQPKILKILKILNEVGLGYITIGQQATTLSGGEAQRVKLASELSKKATGNTLYILDEPTTGLHFQDIQHLLFILQKLVDQGNTVLIIEHNMDVIKVADYIVDLGPEGGEKGGQIVAQGSPEMVIEKQQSYTAQFLKTELHS